MPRTNTRSPLHRRRRMTLSVVILLACAVAASSSLSQPAYQRLPWVPTEGPLGGLGYDIRYNFGDPSIWYVTDAWSGVHRSTDRGITWAKSNDGMSVVWGPAGDAITIFSLTVDPHDPDIVWAGTQHTGQIFKSTDGGVSWDDMSESIDPSLIPHLSFRGFKIDPAGSDIVYAMGEIGSPAWTSDGSQLDGMAFDRTMGIVYRTRNGGLSWEEIRREDNLARYCWVDPVDPDVLYVSTGIFDREAANTDVEGEFPGGVGILKSVDGGRSWNVLDETNGLTDLYIGSLFMKPNDPQVLLAAAAHDAWSGYGPEHTGAVLLTENGGATWRPVLQGELFSTVEFCPSNPEVAYAASYDAVYRSDDGGHSWQRFTRADGTWGSPGLVAGFPIDMQCDPEDPMRIAVNNYLGGNFLSRDGGRHWWSTSRGYTGALVRSVATAPGRTATVYSGSRSGVFRSENAGEHWLGTQYPPPEILSLGLAVKLTEIITVAVDPFDADHVVASSIETGGLLASEDAGRSWRVPPLPHGTFPALSLAFAPANPNVVYFGAGPFKCKEEPGVDAATCNVAGSGVLVSEDGGGSWARAAGPALDDIAVLAVEAHPTHPDTVLAGTYSNGLHRSLDRGASWIQVGVGLPALPVLDLAIHPLATDLVFAGMQGGAVYRSEDGGATFVQSSAGLDPNARAYSVVVDPTDPRIAYVADLFSGVYVSTDIGATWVPLNDGLQHRAAKALALSEDGSVLYAGIEGAGVWRLGTPPVEPADHDRCAGAVEIGTGTHAELFLPAGADGSDSCSASGGGDLWYRHTAAANGTLHVNTCGTHDVARPDEGLDTVVSVHAGCPGTADNELPDGCSDDWRTGSHPDACVPFDRGVPRDGAVAVPVAAGQEVWIRVENRVPGAVEEFWLTVSPYYPPAGSVPDVAGEGVEPLRLAKTVAGELRLTWGTSCWTSDADYSVYRGEMTDYSSHVPETCSTDGATAFETGLTRASYYYLIVPHNGLNEGSYGFVGVPADPPIERPPSASACRPQVIAECS